MASTAMRPLAPALEPGLQFADHALAEGQHAQHEDDRHDDRADDAEQQQGRQHQADDDRQPAEADGFTMVSGASDFNTWSDLEQIRLAAGYNAGDPSGWKVDEIRFADTWQETLPYSPLTVTSLLPGTLKDQVRIEWMAAPGFTDSVEWSPDLTQWFPYADSLRLNGPVAGPVVYETPAGGSGPRYFRVRRAY